MKLSLLYSYTCSLIYIHAHRQDCLINVHLLCVIKELHGIWVLKETYWRDVDAQGSQGDPIRSHLSIRETTQRFTSRALHALVEGLRVYKDFLGYFVSTDIYNSSKGCMMEKAMEDTQSNLQIVFSWKGSCAACPGPFFLQVLALPSSHSHRSRSTQ